MRRITAGVLLLLVASLYAVPLAQATSAAHLGRSCCKGRCNCCHKRSGAAGWTASRRCEGRCGIGPLLAERAFVLAPSGGPLAIEFLRRNVACPAPVSTPICSAYPAYLYQIPPPRLA